MNNTWKVLLVQLLLATLSPAFAINLDVGIDDRNQFSAPWSLATGSNYDSLRLRLSDLGFNVVPMTSFELGDLVGLDMLILTQPRNVPYSAAETAAIHEFVSAGGGLLIAAEGVDTWPIENLNAMIAPYGIALSDGAGSEAAGHEIFNLVPHPVTDLVTSFVVDYQRRLASISSPAQDLTAGTLADDSLAVFGGSGNGNVVVVSDTSLWLDAEVPGDTYIGYKDNARLLDNIALFLSYPGIVPTVPDGVRFLDQETLRWDFIIGMDAYNVYQSETTALPASHGTCLLSGIENVVAEVAANPAVGTAWFYLVTGIGFDGESVLGVDSDGARRDNLTPCP